MENCKAHWTAKWTICLWNVFLLSKLIPIMNTITHHYWQPYFVCISMFFYAFSSLTKTSALKLWNNGGWWCLQLLLLCKEPWRNDLHVPASASPDVADGSWGCGWCCPPTPSMPSKGARTRLLGLLQRITIFCWCQCLSRLVFTVLGMAFWTGPCPAIFQITVLEHEWGLLPISWDVAAGHLCALSWMQIPSLSLCKPWVVNRGTAINTGWCQREKASMLSNVAFTFTLLICTVSVPSHV